MQAASLLSPSLPAESERLAVIADAAPVMLWLAGPDRQFEWFNRQWLEYTGRALQQEQGAGWLDGVHIEDLERCAGIYHASFDARERFTMDLRLRGHDGIYRWFMVSGAPRVASDGTLLGYAGICVDIDERKRLEDQLAERMRSLREQRKHKDTA